jgi:hypothetical protein
MIKYILAFTLFCNVSFAAECAKDISIIKKDQPAQCDGFLISKSQEQYFNDLYERNDLLSKQLSKTDELNKLLVQRVDITNTQLITCNKATEDLVTASKKDVTWTMIKSGVVGVLLGVLIGVVVAKK